MPKEAKKAENLRLKYVAEAFADLTHRDMMDLAEVFCEALDAHNGMKVKPLVVAECFDSLGEYLAIETEVKDG